MKKIVIAFVFTFCILKIFSQNVGIGTNTPAAKLEVKSTANNPLQIGGASNMYMSLYEDNFFRGYLGSLSGGPDDVDLGTSTSNGNGRLHLTIQSQPKLTIYPSGNVALSSYTADPLTQLYVPNVLSTNSTSIYADNLFYGSQRYAISGEIKNDIGAAIYGLATNVGGYAGFENGRYGILGITGDSGRSVGAFTLNGIGVRTKATGINGLAIHATGKLKFTGIGEAANNVLTSDVDGNATWQPLPAGSNVWGVNGSNIYNTNSGNVGIGSSSPQYGLEVKSPNGTIFHMSAPTSTVGNTVRIIKDIPFPFFPDNNGAALKVEAGGDNIGAQFSSSNSYGIYASTNYSSGLISIAALAGDAQWATGVYGHSIHGYGAVFESANSTAVNASATGPGNAVAAYSNTGNALFGRSGGGVTARIENLNAANNNNLTELVQFSQGTALKIAASSGVGLELQDGSIKVSGSKRTAFQVTGTNNNFITISSVTTLANDPNDMLFVTHKGVAANVNTPVYVKWNGSNWQIFTESGANIPTNEVYNVLVIKQ